MAANANLNLKVILHWQHYTRRRAKLFEAATSQQVISLIQNPQKILTF